MSLLEDFDKTSYSSLEMQTQDFESPERPVKLKFLMQVFDNGENDENGSFDEYFKGDYNHGNDKGDSFESALKMLNTYCKTQGRTDDTVTYWDGQVREMMATVKRIRETLPIRTKMDNVFHFCDEEMDNAKLPESEEEIKASIAEIAKMDAVLKIKQAEEKKAKLDTIQSEEESRDILTKMLCFERSTGIRNNFEEFMKLLSESENTETNSTILPQLEGASREYQKEDKNKKEEKKENQDSSKLQKTISKFVERNIKLAKCGRGTLSVTEEEKTRLEDLLGDSETTARVAEELKESKEPPIEEVEDPCIAEEQRYGIDSDMQSALSRIDEQLEVLRSKRTSSVCSISFLEKVLSEEKISDEEEKQNATKRKKREKTPERLEKINKQLQLMNSTSREEIRPLSEKELASLVKQSKRTLRDWKKVGENQEDVKLEDVISELVSNAKSLMPRFKYRFRKS